MRLVAATRQDRRWNRLAFLTEAPSKIMPGSLTRPMH